MKKTLIPKDVGFRVAIYIDFEIWLKVHAIGEKTGHRGGAERVDAWENAIGKLKNVDETCFSHQCWLTYNCQSTTYEGMQKEVLEIKAKVDRLNKKYMRAA